MLLVAFVVGIFPNSGVRWLTAQANRVTNQSNERDSELLVRNLLGVSQWHEARLSMMGIDDAQNFGYRRSAAHAADHTVRHPAGR